MSHLTSVDTQILVFSFLELCIHAAITVGLDRTEYTVSEDSSAAFEVCIVITGEFERSVNVFVLTQDITARSK